MLHIVMSPLGLGCLVLLLRWWVRWRGIKGAVWACNVTLMGCFVLMTPLGANSLVRVIEGNRLQQAPCAQDAGRQLVLLTGGASAKLASVTDFAALTPQSSGRLFDLLASGVMSGDRTLLISGGGRGISEASVVRQLAIRLGVPDTRILIEERSRSTWENAQGVAQMQPPVNRRIVLVTSALHMQRAAYSFRKQGFDVCEFPVNSVYVPPGGIGYILPQGSALLKSNAAIHELIGRFLYRLRHSAP